MSQEEGRRASAATRRRRLSARKRGSG